MIVKQTTLIKHFPFLPNNTITNSKTRISSTKNKKKYTLILNPDNSIHIKEKHCLRCGHHLVKNGSNTRKVILDKWKGERTFTINRKRCENCGEIKPDYSKLAPKYGNYHKNFKARVRRHYMEGLMPPQIQRVIEVDFGISISHSTIVRWVTEAEKPLRTMLKETPVPSSGYWGYDEIHMKIKGEKHYTIDTVDLNTKFIPVARITTNMGRSIGKKVLQEGRRHAALKIKGIVKDCTANLGGMFKTHGYKNIRLQNCKTHVKWLTSRHIKVFAGLPQGSSKPVPEGWRWLVKEFYDVIDAKNETDVYVKLAILRISLRTLPKRKGIKRIKTAFDQIIKWIPKLIAHCRDPNLHDTNNMLEAYHNKFTYYPSFKKKMNTIRGAQRVLDYRVFGHNYKQFPRYIQKYKKKYKRWRALLPKYKGDRIFCGQGNHYRAMFKKLDKWFGNYKDIWTRYFAIT